MRRCRNSGPFVISGGNFSLQLDRPAVFSVGALFRMDQAKGFKKTFVCQLTSKTCRKHFFFFGLTLSYTHTHTHTHKQTYAHANIAELVSHLYVYLFWVGLWRHAFLYKCMFSFYVSNIISIPLGLHKIFPLNICLGIVFESPVKNSLT